LVLYSVGEGSGALALVPGGSSERPAGRLSGDGDDLRIELGEGRSVPVAPGAVAGFVERAQAPDPGHLALSGWAADPHRRKSISRVLVFLDGRLLATGKPQVSRPDVAKTYGPPAARSGYRFSIARLEAGSAARRVRVFAVSAGRASELERLRSAGG
jgi:hypothetical protein